MQKDSISRNGVSDSDGKGEVFAWKGMEEKGKRDGIRRKRTGTDQLLQILHCVQK